MKMEEIRQLSDDELKMKLEDAAEEMTNLRFLHSTHQLDNPMRLRTVRKDIARLMTILHEKKLNAAK
jgi:large subunit ribosomal protein L29